MAIRPSPEILTSFEDALGNRRKASRETVTAIEAAMGKPPVNHKAAVMVVRRGQRRRLRTAARITLEDGAVLTAGSSYGNSGSRR